MVRVAAQERFLSHHNLNAASLSYTQKAELIKLPDGDEKVKLVRKLQKKRISTRQTAKLVAQKRKKKRRTKPLGPTDLGHDKDLERPLDTAKVGLKELLLAPSPTNRIFDEDLLWLIGDDDAFAEEWKLLNGETLERLAEYTDEAINKIEIMLIRFRILRSQLRRLQDSG